MSISNTVLGVSAAANLLVGSGTLGTATTTIYFCNRNPAGTAVAFNMYVVPAGFIANSNNQIYSNKLIASNDTYIADIEKIFLGPGDQLMANANTGNAIIATVSSIGL
jgi:hypothetical protein